MSATALRTELVIAGLTVVEEPGWKTRGGTWAKSKPLGVMQHHTAPPNPFPISALYANNKIKANIGTHEDGTVYLIAYRACNYSSGKGSSVVLNTNVKPGVPPTENALQRGLTDDMGGNRYFWNFENSHPGNGTPMPAVQSWAIAVASSVVNAHFGLSEKNMVSHAEWTRRKGDPYWDGSRRIIEKIRTDTAEVGDDVPLVELTQEQIDAINWMVGALASDPSDPPPWGQNSWDWYQDEWTSPPAPLGPVTHIQLAHVSKRQQDRHVKDKAALDAHEDTDHSGGGAHDHDGDYLKDVKGVK